MWLRQEWRQCADVVVVGDSTASIAVMPDVVEDQLRGYRVANFGFATTFLSDAAYEAAAENVLDPATPSRAVVIDVNYQDVAHGGGRSYFNRQRKEAESGRRAGRGPSLALDWHDELDLRLRPRGLCFLLWGSCPWGARMPLDYNGRLPMVTTTHDATLAIPDVVSELGTSELSYGPPSVEPLARWIRKLREQHIEVIVYVERNPTIDPLTLPIGYVPSWYEAQFRDAGAVVLDWPEGLESFDGRHLDDASARRLSISLGRALAARLSPRTDAPGGRCAWPTQSRDR